MSEEVRRPMFFALSRPKVQRPPPPGSINSNIPQVFRDMILKSEAGVEKIRKEIKLCSRIIVLHRYYLTVSKSRNLPKNDIFYSRLFKPNIAISFLGITNMVQSASNLIQFLLKNPNKFAEAIFSFSKGFDFTHLVSQIIPSVFGFFSSSEMVNYAAKFYLSSLKFNNHKIVIEILLPYFFSGLSASFFDNLISRFHPLVSATISIMNDKSIMLLEQEYAHTFIRFCGECLEFMHSSLVYILKTIIQLKWDDSELIELFFNRFVISFIHNWSLKFKMKQKRILIEQIMLFVPKLIQEIHEFKKEVLNATGYLYVPDFKQGKDKNPFQNLVCVKDINQLATIIHQANMFPPEISITDFEYPEKKRYNWFWVDIFADSIQYDQYQLFDENDDVGKLFDTIITRRRWDSDLSDWYNKIQKFEGEIVLELMYKIVLSIPSSEIITTHSTFYNFENHFPDNVLKQEFFLVTSRLIISRILEKDLAYLFDMSKQFIPIISNYPNIPSFTDFYTALAHKSSKKNLSHCVSLISSIAELTLPTQFQLITDVLVYCNAIAKREQCGDVIYYVVLNSANAPTLLATCTLLYAFVINVQTLAKILGADKLALWQQLDNIIIILLSMDPKFLENYLEIRKTLCELGSLNYGIDFRKSISAPALSRH